MRKIWIVKLEKTRVSTSITKNIVRENLKCIVIAIICSCQLSTSVHYSLSCWICFCCSSIEHLYWFEKMASSSSFNDFVTCPYNKGHVVLRGRLTKHLVRCSRNSDTTNKLLLCPFNANHRFNAEQLKVSHIFKLLQAIQFSILCYCVGAHKSMPGTCQLGKVCGQGTIAIGGWICKHRFGWMWGRLGQRTRCSNL